MVFPGSVPAPVLSAPKDLGEAIVVSANPVMTRILSEYYGSPLIPRAVSSGHWPVDFTVNSVHEAFLRLTMRAQGYDKVPFIWFWPDGASGCLILTHDVETAAGRDFTSSLMDISLGRLGTKSNSNQENEGFREDAC